MVFAQPTDQDVTVHKIEEKFLQFLRDLFALAIMIIENPGEERDASAFLLHPSFHYKS